MITKDFKYLLSLPSLWSLLTQGLKMLYYWCWGETRHQQNSFQVVFNSPSSSNLFSSGHKSLFQVSVSWLCIDYFIFYIFKRHKYFFTWRFRFLNYWVFWEANEEKFANHSHTSKGKIHLDLPQSDVALMEDKPVCLCSIYKVEIMQEHKTLT